VPDGVTYATSSNASGSWVKGKKVPGEEEHRHDEEAEDRHERAVLLERRRERRLGIENAVPISTADRARRAARATEETGRRREIDEVRGGRGEPRA
jgi:hypothetical protein